MERLTRRGKKNRDWVLINKICSKATGAFCPNAYSCDQVDNRTCPYLEVLDRLCEYEDTNLTPSEILALKAEVERLKAEQSNEPLTLEELKQMDGEPVYCIDGQGNEMWCVVNTENEDCIDNESGAWQFCFYGMTGDTYRELHGMGWLGYRRKPEERKNDGK